MRIINYLRAHFFDNLKCALKINDLKLASLLQRKSELELKLKKGNSCCLVQWYREYSLKSICKQEVNLQQKRAYYKEILCYIDNTLTDDLYKPVYNLTTKLMDLNDQKSLTLLTDIFQDLDKAKTKIDIASLLKYDVVIDADKKLLEQVLLQYKALYHAKCSVAQLKESVSKHPKMQGYVAALDTWINYKQDENRKLLNETTAKVKSWADHLYDTANRHRMMMPQQKEAAVWLDEFFIKVDRMLHDTGYPCTSSTVKELHCALNSLRECIYMLEVSPLRRHREAANTGNNDDLEDEEDDNNRNSLFTSILEAILVIMIHLKIGN